FLSLFLSLYPISRSLTLFLPLSSGEGEPVTHTPSICTGQSELTQTPSLTPASQSDKGADQLPRKRFQRAGLYSDDYKTTDNYYLVSLLQLPYGLGRDEG
ncbi:unnamed protein product, partial [Oncorhynchus mykiss]